MSYFMATIIAHEKSIKLDDTDKDKDKENVDTDKDKDIDKNKDIDKDEIKSYNIQYTPCLSIFLK